MSVLVIAHRTPSADAARQRLARAGATVFELDVRLERHLVVVSHFMPALGIPGWLENDVWRWRWHHRALRDVPLAEALAGIPPGCEVLLDLKEETGRRRARLNDRVAELVPDPERCYVSTGNTHDLAYFRAAGYRTWRTVASRRDLAKLLAVRESADHGITARHGLLAKPTVDALCRVSPLVVAWTVNDVTRAERLVELGVGGITSDSLAVVKRLGQLNASRGSAASG